MSIEPHPQLGVKVREDLNIYRHPGTDCFGRRAAVVRRGTILLQILCILAILLQTITIKGLSDLVLLVPAAAIDMQVLTDLEFILCILCILAILLQTLRRNSNTENLTKIAKKDMILTQDYQDASKVRKDLNVYRTTSTTRSKGP